MTSWDEGTKRMSVWAKARVVWGEDPLYCRQDDYGNLIYWFHYGDDQSPFGWEIDHVLPKSLRGTDDLNNLRPLNCSANRSRQNRISGRDFDALLESLVRGSRNPWASCGPPNNHWTW